jgi:membrane-associated phospholipid phosphatase
MLQFLIDLAKRCERWTGQAGAILGGLLIALLLVAWLGRWATRHEVAVRQAGSRFLQRPRVSALRQRFAPQISFLQARFSPTGYLGLQLTAGAAVLLGASWLFGGIAEDVMSGDPITVIDVQVSQWFHAHAHPLLTRAMLVVTHLHGPAAVMLAVALIAAYLAWKRNWYWLLCVGLTVPSGMLLNIAMKYAFHRARPSFDDPLLTLTTYSFPSGHVAGATLFYGVMAAMVMARTRAWRWRVATVLGAILMVALVALTRVYLGAHYLSDVLAAFAEGVAWLTLCLTAIHTYWAHRFARKNLSAVYD